MNPLFSRLVNRLRRIRFSLSPKSRILTFGAIYLGPYKNYKHDPTPLIWIQWSDEKYTHGINLHYLDSADRAWFMRTIYLMARGGQRISPRIMYNFLKLRRRNIVRVAYRKYFTNLLDVRLVSPGITNLHRLVYTDHNENFIKNFNQTIKPSSLFSKSVPSISYSDTELQERVIQATQTIPITQRSVAPYIRQEGNKAPWLRGS